MDTETRTRLEELLENVQKDTDAALFSPRGSGGLAWVGLFVGLAGIAVSVVALVGESPGAFGRVSMFMLFFLFIIRSLYVIIRERMNRHFLVILQALLSERKD